MAGITLDTGALIGFERAARRTMAQLKLAEQFGCELTIPTPVIVEAAADSSPAWAVLRQSSPRLPPNKPT